MFDRVVSKNPFMLVYCRSKTQKICNEAVDGCAEALKFIPDWFVTMKMLEMFHEMLEIFHHTNDEIIIFDEDFSKVTYFANGIGIVDVDVNKINFEHDKYFYENGPEFIVLVRLLDWCNKFENHKAFKKDLSKELMSVTWHPTRSWDWCLPLYEKKKNQLLLIKLGRCKNAFSACQ